MKRTAARPTGPSSTTNVVSERREHERGGEQRREARAQQPGREQQPGEEEDRALHAHRDRVVDEPPERVEGQRRDAADVDVRAQRQRRRGERQAQVVEPAAVAVDGQAALQRRARAAERLVVHELVHVVRHDARRERGCRHDDHRETREAGGSPHPRTGAILRGRPAAGRSLPRDLRGRYRRDARTTRCATSSSGETAGCLVQSARFDGGGKRTEDRANLRIGATTRRMSDTRRSRA